MKAFKKMSTAINNPAQKELIIMELRHDEQLSIKGGLPPVEEHNSDGQMELWDIYGELIYSRCNENCDGHW